MGVRKSRPDVQLADQRRPGRSDRVVWDARAARRDGGARPLPARGSSLGANQAQGPSADAGDRRAWSSLRRPDHPSICGQPRTADSQVRWLAGFPLVIIITYIMATAIYARISQDRNDDAKGVER